MTRKETINRNIGLTFDFVREMIKNPALATKLPAHCEIEFVEKDFPVKSDSMLRNKYIVKVKSAFEPINKVAEPQPKYGRKKK